MENKTIVTLLIINLALSLGLAGDRTIGSVLENELKDYYVCILNNETSGGPLEFSGGISGTAYSGYPYADSRKGAKRCGTTENKGTWVKLSIYATEAGIDPYTLLTGTEEPKPEPLTEASHKKEICGFDGCVPIP